MLLILKFIILISDSFDIFVFVLKTYSQLSSKVKFLSGSNLSISLWSSVVSGKRFISESLFWMFFKLLFSKLLSNSLLHDIKKSSSHRDRKGNLI